jgi:hypothetical protein
MLSGRQAALRRRLLQDRTAPSKQAAARPAPERRERRLGRQTKMAAELETVDSMSGSDLE